MCTGIRVWAVMMFMFSAQPSRAAVTYLVNTAPFEWIDACSTKHVYRIYTFSAEAGDIVTWNDHQNFASSQLLAGRPGHLLTVTSAAEDFFLDHNHISRGFTAARGVAGGFVWAVGPEAGAPVTIFGEFAQNGTLPVCGPANDAIVLDGAWYGTPSRTVFSVPDGTRLCNSTSFVAIEWEFCVGLGEPSSGCNCGVTNSKTGTWGAVKLRYR